MGNDGGSIPDRRDLVRSKPKAEQADKANQTRARWQFCALSKKPLQEPIVSCALGKLYNKDSIIEFLIDHSAYGDGDRICGHVRNLKDVKQLKLTPNPAPKQSSNDDDKVPSKFVCPLTMKEMTGAVPFVYLATCGDVFSQAGLKTVTSASASSSTPSPPPTSSVDHKVVESTSTLPLTEQLDLCPSCATKFSRVSDVRLINPGPEDEERMFEAMLLSRASESNTKKSSKKKRKAGEAALDSAEQPATKKPAAAAPSLNPSIAAASRIVKSSLEMEEAKRKKNMSEAVKSLYSSNGGKERKETFMTMGTFTRYA